jgi:hypothetical protein
MAVWLSKNPGPVQFDHIIIEAILLMFIVICSIRIAILKKREANIVDADEGQAYLP